MIEALFAFGLASSPIWLAAWLAPKHRPRAGQEDPFGQRRFIEEKLRAA